MQRMFAISFFILLMLSIASFAQGVPKELPSTGSSQMSRSHSAESIDAAGKVTEDVGSSATDDSNVVLPHQSDTQAFGVRDKFGYYVIETYLNPSALTAPAFRASLRMANPPGKGATHYPAEWRQGAEAFGRNYGDAFAERVSFHTARFLTGAIIREDPRYIPSRGDHVFARSVHALAFAFVDRSDSGHPMPAISNFVGAAAGGFVGNAYLPSGFNDLTHAGQRATFRFGIFAAGNLFREFAPQMPRPMRTVFELIAR
jgi:hypothetical protein